MNKVHIFIYVGTVVIVLIVFALLQGIIPGVRDTTPSVALTFWGTQPEGIFKPHITDYVRANEKTTITYIQKNPATYEEELINALATGRGPDIWTLPPSWIKRHRDKLFPLPTLLMTEREFTDTYVPAARDLFLQDGAILGLPYYTDPLVLFWNKDFFASEAIALPPTTWDEFLMSSERLTRRAPDGTLTRAGAAMGLSENIPEAKDIVSLLILQGGTSLIDPQTKQVTLGEERLVNKININPSASALRFYTDFAKRTKTSYSWANTFPDPPTAFAAENLAMFIGYAHNLEIIRAKNPRVAAGIATVPQFSEAPIKINYARAEALTVSLASQKKIAAWQFIKYLTSPKEALRISETLNLAPARRDLLAQAAQNPERSVFYESALRAKTWFDPHEIKTKEIFEDMIASALGGRNPATVASEGASKLQALLK